MSREAMQQALEALDDANTEFKHLNNPYGFVSNRQMKIMDKCHTAITALRKALEQPAQQEVDWEKLYRLEVKKKEALAAKYERDTGKQLTRIVPMNQPAQQEPMISTDHGPWIPSTYPGEEGETYCKRCQLRFKFFGYRQCEPHIVYRDPPQPALKTKYKQARSLTDELMDCVDRLGSEADTVDPRVWQHLLVYAPKQEPVAWADAIIDDLQGLFDTDGITEQDSGDALIRLSDAIAAVEDEKKRYTAPPKQEPVAWIDQRIHGWPDCFVMQPDPPHTAPLYTAPSKQWVGLSDEEIDECERLATIRHQRHKYSVRGQIITPADGLEWHFAGAIEAKLKEKNT